MTILGAAGFYAVSPTTVYTFDLLFSVTEDNYDISVIPTFYLRQIPRFNLLKTYSVTSTYKYSMLGINSALLDVNMTVLNVNGTVFFTARFRVDTLAEHKFQVDKQYDATSYTRNVTLQLDAYLFVDFDNQTDIERTFSGEWELTLP